MIPKISYKAYVSNANSLSTTNKTNFCAEIPTEIAAKQFRLALSELLLNVHLNGGVFDAGGRFSTKGTIDKFLNEKYLLLADMQELSVTEFFEVLKRV